MLRAAKARSHPIAVLDPSMYQISPCSSPKPVCQSFLLGICVLYRPPSVLRGLTWSWSSFKNFLNVTSNNSRHLLHLACYIQQNSLYYIQVFGFLLVLYLYFLQPFFPLILIFFYFITQSENDFRRFPSPSIHNLEKPLRNSTRTSTKSPLTSC